MPSTDRSKKRSPPSTELRRSHALHHRDLTAMLRPVPLALLFTLFALAAPAASHAYGPWEGGRAHAGAAKSCPDSPCAKSRVTVVQDAPGTALPDGTSTASLWGYVLWDAPGHLSEGCTVHVTAAVSEHPS